MWLHLAVDSVNIVLCALIAHEAWRRYKEIKSAFHLLWTAAFVVMAGAELAHATLPILSGQQAWIPSIWVAGRLMLAVVFYAAVLDAHRIVDYRRRDVGVLLGLSAFLAIVTTVSMSAGLIVWSGPTTYETTSIGGVVLAVVWAGCIPLVYWHPHARIQMPRGFVAFLLLGFGVHLAMSMSGGVWDRWFWIGHGLKVAEYGVWLFSARAENHTNGVTKLIANKGALYHETEAALDLLRESSKRANELARRMGE